MTGSEAGSPVARSLGVTGASGMVGREIVRHMRAGAIKGVVASRTPVTTDDARIAWKRYDLCESKTFDELDAIFGDVDAIIHAGALIPGHSGHFTDEEIFLANVHATHLLGKWALNRKMPFVFLSGCIVYADPERENIIETDPVGPHRFSGTYGLTKILGEQVLRQCAFEGLDTVILRPTSIYGPGLPDSKFLSRLLRQASEGNEITLEPHVEDRHNLIPASDVARACLDALAGRAFGVYNIGADDTVSVREIAEACVRVAGRGSIRIAGGGSEGEASPTIRYGTNSNAAKNDFGFACRTDLDTGLGDLLGWLTCDRVSEER